MLQAYLKRNKTCFRIFCICSFALLNMRNTECFKVKCQQIQSGRKAASAWSKKQLKGRKSQNFREGSASLHPVSLLFHRVEKMACLEGQSETVLHICNFATEGGRDCCKRLNRVFLKQFGWRISHAIFAYICLQYTSHLNFSLQLLGLLPANLGMLLSVLSHCDLVYVRSSLCMFYHFRYILLVGVCQPLKTIP